MAGLLGAALVLVGFARPAHAWTLGYEVPAGCDDATTFRARAEAQRARPGEVAGVSVQVRAWREPSGTWRVHVVVNAAAGAAPGERELGGTTCSEVTDAAALIVAFLLDGAREREMRAPAPVPRATRVPPARDPEPSDARAPSAPVWLSLSLAGGVDSGTLPAAVPGVRGELSLGWRRASLALGVAGWARVREVDRTGEGMSVGAWQGHVAGRVRVWRGLAVGGSFEIGQLDAVGVGVDTVIERTIGWQGVGGAILWRGPLWRDLEFTMETDVLWPFVRPNFVVDGEPRFTPGPCLRLWTGLAWRFL